MMRLTTIVRSPGPVEGFASAGARVLEFSDILSRLLRRGDRINIPMRISRHLSGLDDPAAGRTAIVLVYGPAVGGRCGRRRPGPARSRLYSPNRIICFGARFVATVQT